MDRSAQNIDRSSESEIRNLRRLKYAFDASPLEIIYNEEDFIHGGGGVLNTNQISLIIHAINYDTIFQYWSLKSDQQQLNSSSCHDQHHRDHHHHHLRDDDDDEEMIMIVCQPLCPPMTRDQIILLDQGVFASNYAAEDDDDDHHIMSQLNDVDAFYELEWIGTYKQLEEVKRSIIQRISEAKLDVQLTKPPPKTVRIRVDLSVIHKRYYANPAAAASGHAEYQLGQLAADEAFAIHYPAVPACKIKYVPPYKIKYGNVSTPALRSSQEALETKIFKEEDLISSSSSCSLCLNEFRVGVDVIRKMPCSHMFHLSCLAKRLSTTNTCPLCHYKLPTFRSRFLKDRLP